MKAAKILFVENDAEFLKNRSKILEAEGYEVISVVRPEDAEKLLQTTSVDLAIVDLRLQDDSDEADTSGLTLIKSVAPKVPKILLTAYPTEEITRRALKNNLNDLPGAIDIVPKQDGIKVFLQSVALAVERHVSRNRRSRLFKKISSLIVLLAIIVVGLLLLFKREGGIKEAVIVLVIAVTLKIIAAIVQKSVGIK